MEKGRPGLPGPPGFMGAPGAPGEDVKIQYKPGEFEYQKGEMGPPGPAVSS